MSEPLHRRLLHPAYSYYQRGGGFSKRAASHSLLDIAKLASSAYGVKNSVIEDALAAFPIFPSMPI
jgi:hypothetical protein